jgi:hypothetical protein
MYTTCLLSLSTKIVYMYTPKKQIFLYKKTKIFNAACLCLVAMKRMN